MQGGKATNRATLNQVAKHKGVEPFVLYELPEVDELVFYLWDYFVEVFSGVALSFVELDAWARLTQRELNPDEIKILRDMSIEATSIHANGNSKTSPSS